VRRRGRRRRLLALLAAILALAAFADFLPHDGNRGVVAATPLVGPAGAFPHPLRVAVLLLENKGYNQVIGSPRAPYLNHLARRYALATRYYALTHPSLPNYLALTGGAPYGIRHNCRRCQVEAPNLVTQLDGARIPWKAYFEGLPSRGYLGRRTATYSPNYNPFVHYEGVRASSADRMRIVSFIALRRDLRRRRLPRFAWIAPDLLHDSHNASLRASDRYLSHLVPRVLRALGPHGVLYLTWDEAPRHVHSGLAGTPGGGRVALIAAGGAARRGKTTAVGAGPYSLLRSIEAGFGLPALRHADSVSTPLLTGLLRPVAASLLRPGSASLLATG
jgi:phosphatidylinositol-3-phosphatase